MKIRVVIMGAATALVMALVSFSASASAAVPFCPPGSEPGQCNGARGLATDWETGHVYVVDRGNERVNVFESDGTFLSSFGPAQLSKPTWIAVDNDEASPSRHDIYVSSGEFSIRKFKPNGELIEALGSEGSGPCQFGRAKDPVAVSSAK